MIIREAQQTDIPGIARVHVDTWKAAFQGVVPESYLKDLNYGESEDTWRQILTDTSDRQFLYVATDDSDQVVGFALGGHARQDDSAYAGELQGIYVLPGHQNQGVGRSLTTAVAERLIKMGISSMLVWTLAASPYRRFYEVLGGQLVSFDSVEIAGEKQKTVTYGWQDLTALITKLNKNS